MCKYDVYYKMCGVDRLVGKGVDIGQAMRIELLPTVWEQHLRVLRRHDITIFIFHGRVGFLAIVAR